MLLWHSFLYKGSKFLKKKHLCDCYNKNTKSKWGFWYMLKTMKGYVFRLYLNDKQKEMIEKSCQT